MTNTSLVRTGMVGSNVVALRCFTTVLVVLLGAVGLASAAGYLDLVLLPALVVFLGVPGIAVVRGLRGHG